MTKGMDFQIPLEFWWSTDINLSLGMDQKVHPSWPISIINAMLKKQPQQLSTISFFSSCQGIQYSLASCSAPTTFPVKFGLSGENPMAQLY